MKNHFARFGIPSTLVTDNATNLTSDLMRKFTESYNIHHVTKASICSHDNVTYKTTNLGWHIMTNKLTFILMKNLGGKEQENNISVFVEDMTHFGCEFHASAIVEGNINNSYF